MEWHVFNTVPAREEFPRMAATVQDVDNAGFQNLYKNPSRVEMDWEMLREMSVFSYFLQTPSPVPSTSTASLTKRKRKLPATCGTPPPKQAATMTQNKR